MAILLYSLAYDSPKASQFYFLVRAEKMFWRETSQAGRLGCSKKSPYRIIDA